MNHVGQRGHLAGVHVGRARRRVPEARGTELAPAVRGVDERGRDGGLRALRVVRVRARGVERVVAHAVHHGVPAGIRGLAAVARRDADHVELPVGEERAMVALEAVGLAEEEQQAASRCVREFLVGLRVARRAAGPPAVVGGWAGHQRALVGGDGLADLRERGINHGRRSIGGRRFGAERAAVRGAQHGVLADALHNAGTRHVHLVRRLEGLHCLAPQRVGTAVPREPALVRGVEHGHRVARAGALALGQRTSVGESLRGIVARGAAHRAACGEALVEEEAMPERRGIGAVGPAIGRVRGQRAERRVAAHAPGDVFGQPAAGCRSHGRAGVSDGEVRHGSGRGRRHWRTGRRHSGRRSLRRPSLEREPHQHACDGHHSSVTAPWARSMMPSRERSK